MRKTFVVVLTLALLSVSLWAAAPKTYQVTGPVLEIKGDVIVVQKGTEKWEIAKDAATKVLGDLKVGDKVTIEYTMTAKAIEVKTAAKPSGKAQAKAAAKVETKAPPKK